MQGLETLIFLALLIGVFYFMLIRPQKRRAQQHRELIESIRPGDDIVTIGGVHGTVRALRDENVEIEIAPGTVVRFVKSAIGRRVSEPVEEPASDAEPMEGDDRG